MNMYEITREYQELVNLITENEGELTPEIEESLKLTKENYDDKLEAYVKVIKNAEAENAAYKAEIDRMKAAKSRNDKLVERLKRNIKESMLLFDISKKNVGVFKLSLTNSTAVEITDDAMVPMEYKVAKYESSKTRIKEAIDAGIEVPGAHLTSNKNLQIK